MSQVEIVSAGIRNVGMRVRREGQAEVFATTVDEFENVSARDRNSFSWSIVPADFEAGTTLLLIQNDNASLHLHITEAEFQTDNASVVRVHLTDRAVLVPTGGTVVTGICWNQTAPRVAEALARSNETANVLGNIIWDFPIAADTLVTVELRGAIILAKGQSIAIDLTTASTSLVSCHMEGFFAIPDEDRT